MQRGCVRAKCRIEMKIDRGGCEDVQSRALKRPKVLSHVPLLAVQYSLAVALDNSVRKYQQKKKKSGENIRRREKRGSEVEIRCYRARIPVMLRLSCVV